MDNGTDNKLLKTLTDSIPESLIPIQSSPAVTTPGPDSGSSSFFSMFSVFNVIIIVVMFGLAFLAFNASNLMATNGLEDLFKTTSTNITKLFSNIHQEINELFFGRVDKKKQKKHRSRDDGADNGADDGSDDGTDNGADDGSDDGADDGAEARPADGSQPELYQPPIQHNSSQLNIPTTANKQAVNYKKDDNKNPRQYAQYNQMQGINSGKRVGQHISCDEDEEDTQNSLDSVLQSAAAKSDSKGSYSADDSGSSVQSKSKAGWCLIGEDKGVRNCIKVGLNDKCLSGDIFPNNNICINPNLRS